MHFEIIGDIKDVEILAVGGPNSHLFCQLSAMSCELLFALSYACPVEFSPEGGSPFC